MPKAKTSNFERNHRGALTPVSAGEIAHTLMDGSQFDVKIIVVNERPTVVARFSLETGN
jgi:hypothetical protein